MATFEEREIVDYTMKKLEKVLDPDNFMIKDLDKMHHRLDKQERKLRKIIEKIESLENKIRCLERERERIFLKRVVVKVVNKKTNYIFYSF